MSRPLLSELTDINPRELRVLSHEQASLKIINALKKSKDEYANRLRGICDESIRDYDELSSINYKIMYLDRAIEARTADYEEMFT